MNTKNKSTIEYLYTEGKIDVPISVILYGKYVGTIKPVAEGWQYFPKNWKEGGTIFKTVSEVQRSLELDENDD